MAVPTIGTVTATYKAAAFPWNNTFSHSGTGASALLVCINTVMSAAWDFTTCTYGGFALTKLFRSTHAQGTTWFYGLNAPPTGTNSLVTTNSGQYGDFGVITAVNLAGTDAVAPFGQTAFGGGSTSLNLAITTTAANSLLVASVAPYYHPAPTFSGSTQTSVWTQTTNSNMGQYGRSVSAATAGAYSVTATVGYNNVFGGMVEILSSGGGGGGGTSSYPVRHRQRVRFWRVT